MAHEPFSLGDMDSRWRVRRVSEHRWPRWFGRTLAQADVRSPDGELYFVRIVRNWPLVRSPLGPVGAVLPDEFSLAATLAANLVTRGRTGWSVHVVRPRSLWRAERVIYRRRSRIPTEIVDRAVVLTEQIGRGHTRWDDETRTFGERVRKVMHWD